MGYNPYICIVCGEIKDEQWIDRDNEYGNFELYQYNYTFSNKAFDFMKHYGLKVCKYHRKSRERQGNSDRITDDVCNKCFNKYAYFDRNVFEAEQRIIIRYRFRKTRAKKSKEEIKANVKTKEERIQYWHMHCKPVKRMYSIAERHNYWVEHHNK